MDTTPCVLKQSTSCWVLLRKYHNVEDQFHHVFMTMVLRWSLNTAQQACHVSLIHSVTCFWPDLPSSNLWLPHFFTHSLAYNPAFYFSRNTESVTWNSLTHPLTSMQVHPLPPVPWPFLPPTNQGWFIHMAKDPSSPALSGNVHYPQALLSLAPSQMDFSPWHLSTHTSFPF